MTHGVTSATSWGFEQWHAKSVREEHPSLPRAVTKQLSWLNKSQFRFEICQDPLVLRSSLGYPAGLWQGRRQRGQREREKTAFCSNYISLFLLLLDKRRRKMQNVTLKCSSCLSRKTVGSTKTSVDCRMTKEHACSGKCPLIRFSSRARWSQRCNQTCQICITCAISRN